MATSLTYTTLSERVRRFIERAGGVTSDFNTELPYLINDAEAQIAVELKAQLFLRSTTAQMTAGVWVYTKPTRWRETISINFGAGAAQETRTQLLPRSYEFVVAYAPDRTAQAAPELYADYDNQHWLFGPTPNAAYYYEVLDYELPQPLDAANQTNKITENAPQLLLYGTLLQTAPYLKNDERLPTWTEKYNRWLISLKGQDSDLITNRAADRRDRA